METLSSILDWRIPMNLEGYSSWGHKELDMTERLSMAQHSTVILNLSPPLFHPGLLLSLLFIW